MGKFVILFIEILYYFIAAVLLRNLCDMNCKRSKFFVLTNIALCIFSIARSSGSGSLNGSMTAGGNICVGMPPQASYGNNPTTFVNTQPIASVPGLPYPKTSIWPKYCYIMNNNESEHIIDIYFII